MLKTIALTTALFKKTTLGFEQKAATLLKVTNGCIDERLWKLTCCAVESPLKLLAALLSALLHLGLLCPQPLLNLRPNSEIQNIQIR